MPYLLIDDGMAENPKVIGLSDKAFRLWITALVYCARNLTDGAISELAIRSLAPNCQIDRPLSVVKQIVEAGLFDETDAGWLVHDFLEYNPSRAEMDRKRAKTRERKRRYDQSRNANRNAVTNMGGNGVKDPPQGGSKDPPRGSSPAGPHGKTNIAAGAVGTRSASKPQRERTPDPEINAAPPPPELLEMFGITKPNILPEPDVDEQDQVLIDYYATLEVDEAGFPIA
jgi:hypothetical protein